jgi:hypothetical protein
MQELKLRFDPEGGAPREGEGRPGLDADFQIGRRTKDAMQAVENTDVVVPRQVGHPNLPVDSSRQGLQPDGEGF